MIPFAHPNFGVFIALNGIDYVIMFTYLCFVIGIGFALNRYMKTSSDFFLSGRSIPAWVAGLAFISANLGALELVGMAASGAKYGIATCHFYWVGAIPAMVFLAVFMMPFYYGSKARSVPEYLKLRFDERARAFNSMTFAVMTVFTSGISMNALAKLMHQLLGWDYNLNLWISSAVVLLYVLKGGLTSAIYTEVLQFFIIVFGFAPVAYLGLKDIGGWGGLHSALQTVAANPAALNLAPAGTTFTPDAWSSSWAPILAGPSQNPMGVDFFAIFFGLGFVVSFGYWCTNFLVIQRAMAAKDMRAARQAPLIASVPKMLFPALVILPGMIAVALAATGKDNFKLPTLVINPNNLQAAVHLVQNAPAENNDLTKPSDSVAVTKLPPAALPASMENQSLQHDQAEGLTADHVLATSNRKLSREAVLAILHDNATSPLNADVIAQRLQDSVTENDYDGVILSLVKKYCPPGLLGLALTGLLASFMSGMAGNVTAFNTVWTYDLYQAYLAPNKSDKHYLRMGQAVTVVGILLSIACAYVASNYSNAMDIVQLVFGFVNAPLFATFLLGMFWARTTSNGAFYGLVGGTTVSALFHGCTIAAGNVPGIKGAWIAHLYTFPVEMAQNFWLASAAFVSCLLLTVVISLLTKRTKTDAELKGLVYSLTPKQTDDTQVWYLRPAFVGSLLLIACLILNIIFW